MKESTLQIASQIGAVDEYGIFTNKIRLAIYLDSLIFMKNEVKIIDSENYEINGLLYSINSKNLNFYEINEKLTSIRYWNNKLPMVSRLPNAKKYNVKNILEYMDEKLDRKKVTNIQKLKNEFETNVDIDLQVTEQVENYLQEKLNEPFLNEYYYTKDKLHLVFLKQYEADLHEINDIIKTLKLLRKETKLSNVKQVSNLNEIENPQIVIMEITENDIKEDKTNYYLMNQNIKKELLEKYKDKIFYTTSIENLNVY